MHALPEDITIYKDTYTEGWDAIRLKRWQRMQQIGLLEAAGVNQLSQVERDLGPPYHFPDAFKILGNGEVNKPLRGTVSQMSRRSFRRRRCRSMPQ